MSHDRNAHIEGQAVHFSMHSPAEHPLKVTIDSGALQKYFGASADPQSWLSAYIANFRVIHAVAQLIWSENVTQVTLDADDFSEESIRELRQTHGE